MLPLQAAAADVLALELPAGRVPPAVQLPWGRLLKVSASVDEATFVDRASHRDAVGIVSVLLSLCAQHKGVSHAPLALFASHMQSCLSALAVEAGHRCAAGCLWQLLAAILACPVAG